MNEFDLKAAGWDKNPMHLERSVAIAREIIEKIPLNREMSVLEYGAGTGITSFILREYVKEITLMDNSAEMVRVIDEKIRSTKVKNLRSLFFNLETDDYHGGTFDMIFTQLVLHHVADIGKIITKFSQLLNSGGWLVIADLYEEDGSFHGEGFTGHKGFNLDSLSGILRKNHFSEISHKPCYVIDRMVTDTKSEQFEVFMLSAKKI